MLLYVAALVLVHTSLATKAGGENLHASNFMPSTNSEQNVDTLSCTSKKEEEGVCADQDEFSLMDTRKHGLFNEKYADTVTCTHNTVAEQIEHQFGKPSELKPTDNGTALILTPFIENGRLEDARKAAKVDPKLFLGLELYTGYFTVDKKYDSNTFFWYFPVEGKPVSDTPWILYLQGGPGVATVVGVFDEVGPFKVNSEGNLKKNHHSWHQNQSMVFIENPIGSGYSFTNHKDGYARDMATYIKHLYSALEQFLTLFPELRAAPLFIAGESYAGMFVPSLSMEIHERKQLPGGDINLRGLILCNARTEPDMLSEVIRPFYHFGLLVEEQMQLVMPLVDELRSDIAARRSVIAKEKWARLVTVLKAMSHQKNEFNILQDARVLGDYEKFLHKSEVKRAIHVGDIKFTISNITVKDELAPNFLSNPKPTIEALLNHYDVLVLCGQLDTMMSCAVSSERHRGWRWDYSAAFLKATRYPLMFDNRPVGCRARGRFLCSIPLEFEGDNLMSQSATFVSGFESSAIATTFTLMELAKKKEYQDRARLDIKEAIAKHGWTVKAMDEMKYLGQCLSESLRLHPTVSTLDRYPLEDYQIPNSDLVIKKGTPLFISMYGLHEDPRYFEDPLEFKPERFDPDRVVSDAYMPFSIGPRMCLGVPLGQLHVKVVLSMILSEYELSQKSEEVKMDHRSTFTAAADGINLEFTRLSS